MATIGFLGLGSMGTAIATRLADAGHALVVWNRSPHRARPLVDCGATLADVPEEALACEVSLSMLADDRAAEAVLTAQALGHGPAGRTHACLSSISPGCTDRLAAVADGAGVAYLAAPVLGRPDVAAAGRLHVLAAGAPRARAAVSELLAVVGQRTWDLGPEPRTASVVKIAVNYTIIHALQAMSESFALVEEHGIEVPLFADLLAETLFPGAVYRGYGTLIAHRSYRPAGFTVPLGAKDLALAEDVAAEVGLPLPTAAVLRQVFEVAARSPEAASDDWSAIAEVTRGRRLS
jgi:3-hydroxyisobutyrate dehydrogenase-like beta-hydroxyacid dehydrogenase